MTSCRLLDPTSKKLLQAAEYMEAKGHCKGVVEGRNGAVCLVGAIRKVEATWKQDTEMQNRVVKFLKFRDFCDAVNWNDAPERTASEVVNALRQAALIEPD